MIYPEFRKLLQNRSIKGAYLFHGEENMVMEEIIDYIKQSYVNPSTYDLNFVHLRGADIDLDELYSSIETIPFMSDYRVVTIDGLGELNRNHNLSNVFFDTLTNIPEDTIVIFYDSDEDLKKNTKLFRYFRTNNRNVEFNKLNNRDLRDHLMSVITKRNKNISYNDLSYFILQTGYENKNLDIYLYEVRSELDKLISYSEDDTITRHDIDNSVQKINDSNIFNLLDSIQSKNADSSLSYLHDLYEKDEPIQVILHMIKRRFRHLYTNSALLEEGVAPADVQKVISISNYEYRNVSNQSRRMSVCEIKDKLDLIYSTEKLLKSTSINPLTLMENLVINLSA